MRYLWKIQKYRRLTSFLDLELFSPCTIITHWDKMHIITQTYIQNDNIETIYRYGEIGDRRERESKTYVLTWPLVEMFCNSRVTRIWSIGCLEETFKTTIVYVCLSLCIFDGSLFLLDRTIYQHNREKDSQRLLLH